jgi:transposase, IS30 family
VGGGGFGRSGGEDRAWARGRRPKAARLACRVGLRAVVEAKLRSRWSPQQIDRWLRSEYPDREQMRVSHQTISRLLFVTGRGALLTELAAQLRRGHATRRPRG